MFSLFFFMGEGGIFPWGDFSWEGEYTLTQNSYKPSLDLYEASL